jgi:hypothetical protein
MIGRRTIAMAVAAVVASSATIASAAHTGILGAARVSETAERVAAPTGGPGGGGDAGGGSGSGGPSLDPFVCREYRHSVAGTVSDASMTEISGMARGRRDPSVLWVHEDSGAQADVHALTLSGRKRQTFRLAGVQAKDWEDMSIGPGPADGVDYLYLGDIGDNGKKRPEIVVHRVREPRVTDGSLTMLDGVASIRLRYPDGPANSEAMAVGADGTIYVITKSKGTRVYMARYPQSTSSVNVMKRVPAGTLSPKVDMSGADIRMDGRALLVRGYRMAWTWPIRPGESMATTLAREPCKTPTFRDEKQGESIAFLANDGSYTTTGEMSRAPIRHYTR